MCVAGSLQYERPFLAPLHKFLSMHPRGSTMTVPAFVAFFLRNRSKNADTTPAQRSSSRPSQRRGSMLRLHRAGRASEDGFPMSCQMGQSTSGLLRGSAWRSRQRIFLKCLRSPVLVISTLEALAILVSLKRFVEHRSRVQVAPTWTDNRGTQQAHDD